MIRKSTIIIENNKELIIQMDYTLFVQNKKICCTPESFNTNISHQNSQHYNTNSKGDFVLKNRFKTFVFKISGIQKQIQLIFGMTS